MTNAEKIEAIQEALAEAVKFGDANMAREARRQIAALLVANGTTREYADAVANERDTWVPANGGTETPLDWNGKRTLYVFNPATGQHAYLDCATDMILNVDEVVR